VDITVVSGGLRGLTPLQVAEKEGSQEMVELLRNAAKDCRYHEDCGFTQACSQRKCMNLCFSANCNNGVNNARDSLGWTPLHEAARVNRGDLAKRLLENSANVDSTDKWGKTALHVAAYWNSVAVAQLLLENSAHVDSTDNNGATALHWAAYQNSVDVAEILIAHSANVNATPVSGSWKGLTPLQVAKKLGNQEIRTLIYSN